MVSRGVPIASFLVTSASSMTDSTGDMGNTKANPYLRDAVMTASQEQLHLMLYDGAIRFALQGREAIERKNYETSYERLTRAQHIMLEMQNGLNPEVNRELCERMASIYSFIYRKLVDGCVNRDVEAVEDAVKVLRIERETWQILVDKVSKVHDQTDELQTTSAAEGPHDAPGFSAES